RGPKTRAVRQYLRRRRRGLQRPDLLELCDRRCFRASHAPHRGVIEALVVRNPAFGIAFARRLEALGDDTRSRYIARSPVPQFLSPRAIGESKHRVGRWLYRHCVLLTARRQSVDVAVAIRIRSAPLLCGSQVAQRPIPFRLRILESTFQGSEPTLSHSTV